jgi:hypothetical protein
LPSALDGAGSLLDLAGTLNDPAEVLGRHPKTGDAFEAIGGYWDNIVDWRGSQAERPIGRPFTPQIPQAKGKYNGAEYGNSAIMAHPPEVQSVLEKDRQRRIDLIVKQVTDRILRGLPLSGHSSRAASDL